MIEYETSDASVYDLGDGNVIIFVTVTKHRKYYALRLELRDDFATIFMSSRTVSLDKTNSVETPESDAPDFSIQRGTKLFSDHGLVVSLTEEEVDTVFKPLSSPVVLSFTFGVNRDELRLASSQGESWLLKKIST